MAEKFDELKKVEVPLGEVRIFLRPKESKYPLARSQVEKMMNYISENFQEVKGTTQPLIIFIPNIIEVIIINHEGEVEVY